ncbi:acyltransferase family protein [soil metagenome]
MIPLGTRSAPTYRADIEGLRGIAILLVVAYHASVPGFTGGYVGVDVFFVLSGYLITGLLAREIEATGTVRLLEFYGRRARRLLPASALVLALTMLVGYLVLAPVEQRSMTAAAVASAAYLSNAYFAVMATDYLGAGSSTNPFLHMWSLAVEEQFYLVWPLMLLLAVSTARLCRRPARYGLLWLVVVVIVASLGLSIWLTEYRQPWAFFLPPTRAWEFAVGGLVALLPATLGRSARFAGWCGLAAVIAAAALFDDATAFPGWIALLPVVGTALIVRAGGGSLAALLEWRPLRALGRLSYSWYLWHWPAIVLATAAFGELSLAARIAVMAGALGLAEATYRLVENPVRRHPVLARRPAPSLWLALAITLSSVTAGVIWRAAVTTASESPEQVRFEEARADIPILYPTACHLEIYEVEVRACTFGPAEPTMTIVLFGDSHAAQWFPALHALAWDRGLRVISLTKSVCPAYDVDWEPPALRRTYAECARWRDAVWRYLGVVRPDVTILAAFGGYGLDRDEWLAGVDDAFSAASRVSGHVVAIRATPIHDIDPGTCLARQAWRAWGGTAAECSFDVASVDDAIFQDEVALAATYPRVSMLDLNEEICSAGTCDLERDGLVVYRDEDHLTASFARTFAERFGRHLDEHVGPPD